MSRQKDNLFCSVIPAHLWLFKDAGLLWIRLKYAPRYRWLRILLIVAILAATGLSVLLMVKGRQDSPWPDKNLLIRFSTVSGSGPITVSSGGKTTWTKSYYVAFAPGEELFVVAELHQPGNPVQPLGQRTFTGSTNPRRLTIIFTRRYKDDARTVIGHSVNVQLGEQVFEIPQFRIGSKSLLNGEVLNWFQGGELRKLHQPHAENNDVHPARLFAYHLQGTKVGKHSSVPDSDVSSKINHSVVINMIPASELAHMDTEFVSRREDQDGEVISDDSKPDRISEIHKQYLIVSASELMAK